MSVIHGGNVYEMAHLQGCSPEAILDYSASINPLGPPPGLLEEINAGWVRLQHYPDIANRSITEALGSYHGLNPSRIIVGNGSTELIYWLPRALGIKKAMVVQPTFGEYWRAFEIQGGGLGRIISREECDFQPTVDQLDEACSRAMPDALLFTNPGSPSGVPLSREVQEWVAQKARGRETFCIVDEVFIDFCEEESLKAHLDGSSSMILIRSLTKFFGLPGLRIGYLLTPDDKTAAGIRNILPPWSVNTLAQIAGPYCLAQREYREETLELVGAERERMIERFESMGAFRVFNGRANYLLMRMDERLPAADVLQRDLFASDRILIRDCRSFEGLGDHHIRVAVRLAEQNDRLLDGIERWVRKYIS